MHPDIEERVRNILFDNFGSVAGEETINQCVMTKYHDEVEDV